MVVGARRLVCARGDGLRGDSGTGGPRGLNVGNAKRVGDCELRLLNATYDHSEPWNLEVWVTLTNHGVEDKRRGWEATLVSGSQQALTETAGAPQTLPTGETVELARIAREKNLTGFSGGLRMVTGCW